MSNSQLKYSVYKHDTMRRNVTHYQQPPATLQFSRPKDSQRINKKVIPITTNQRYSSRTRTEGFIPHSYNKSNSRDRRPKRLAVLKPQCKKFSRLPRTVIMGYIDREVTKIGATMPPYKQQLTSSTANSKHRSKIKPPLVKSLSLGYDNDSQYSENSSSEDFTDNYCRQRSNSLPCDWEGITKGAEELNYERKVLAIMLNLAHIIIGIAITQLGIVGAWYQKYMNFAGDQLRHVLYICVLFIVTGCYGMFVVTKHLGRLKAHQISYKVLSSLCIIAACFIIANGIRLVLADSYRTNELVILIFDGLLIGLSVIEVPVALASIYKTLSTSDRYMSRHISTNELSNDQMSMEKDKPPPSWSSIFAMILNVAHIVLGLCIIELGMVGMLYRRFMNIDGSSLFAIVFTSVSFISAGMIGIYNQLTGKCKFTCNRSIYTGASIIAVGSASTIVTFVSVAMTSKQYYAGIEAIVAFDVMILSMSSLELIVGLAATALCLIPVCVSKLRVNMSSVSS